MGNTLTIPVSTKTLWEHPSRLILYIRLLLLARVVLGEVLLRPTTTAEPRNTESRTFFTTKQTSLPRATMRPT